MNLKGRVAKLEAAKQQLEQSDPSADQLQRAWELATWLGASVSTPAEAWNRYGSTVASDSEPAELTPEMRAWLESREVKP